MAEIFKFPEPKSDPMIELEKIMYGWIVMSNHRKEMERYAELKQQIDGK